MGSRSAVSYTLLFLSTSVEMIIVARLIEGVGVAAFVPSSIASAVDQAPPGKLGETLGWRSLMIGIGFMLGPALGGFLSQLLMDFLTCFKKYWHPAISEGIRDS
jgi:MFS family permease